MRSILDRSFRYTPSFDTDVRRTFDRIRRERHEVRPTRTDADEVVKLPKGSILGLWPDAVATSSGFVGPARKPLARGLPR